jgi:hypothetical protein
MIALLFSHSHAAALALPAIVLWLAVTEFHAAIARYGSLSETAQDREDHWPWRHRGDERY